ncbi:chemotaxis protein [Leptolyngbya sp. Heron Island J]|uniref:CheR family methyltransferase n=1 Tax=Leptolyngbya sp. Heron Island J TaxID=1385935 RepID=UPI0003B96BB7|nr:protein-glutamate O-methyltransferase CheR [Leptolyngbya sp. Heron Island J]ESA35685.1 chemotaxis protein [Leptolyngbya sp. Heron Island J]
MPPTESLSPELTQAFIQLIVKRTGIIIRESDQTAFEETISQRIKLTGSDSIAAYYRLLAAETYKSQEEWDSLTTEITNTESFFFRDKGQFKLLKNHIFPDLIKRQAQTKTMRICSAGCSTGEEPYSIAMLLYDLIPDIKEWNLTILGVDINSIALEKAREGIYRPWSFRGVDQDIQKRFFRQTNDHYHISDDIKTMVSFQTGNLLDNSSSNPFCHVKDIDLILCRNVFIYFSSTAVKTVLDKFYNALCPLGYLLVGHAELYSQNPDRFWVKMFEESMAYQRPGDTTTQPIASRSSALPQQIPSPTATTEDQLQTLDNSLTGVNLQMQKAALNLLRQLPGETRIAKLGNLTASELIQQYEQALKKID